MEEQPIFRIYGKTDIIRILNVFMMFPLNEFTPKEISNDQNIPIPAVMIHLKLLYSLGMIGKLTGYKINRDNNLVKHMRNSIDTESLKLSR